MANNGRTHAVWRMGECRKMDIRITRHGRAGDSFRASGWIARDGWMIGADGLTTREEPVGWGLSELLMSG